MAIMTITIPSKLVPDTYSYSSGKVNFLAKAILGKAKL